MNIKHLPVTFKSSTSAWMMQDIFQEWSDHSLKKKNYQVRNCFQQDGLPEDSIAILVLDKFKAHPEADILIKDAVLTWGKTEIIKL